MRRLTPIEIVEIRDVFVGYMGSFTNNYIGDPVPVRGNAIAMTTDVVAISGTSPTFVVLLYGSHDGKLWRLIDSYYQSAVGYNSLTASGVSYAFVKIHCAVSNGAVDALCYSHTTLCFSAQ